MRDLTKIIAIIFFLIGISISIFGQEAENPITKNQKQNLIKGIQSDNSGVRKSAIYFAGKYRIEEAIPEMEKVLFKEHDENTVMITLNSLGQFRYDKVEGIFANYADYTTNEKLKYQAMSFDVYFNQDTKALAGK